MNKLPVDLLGTLGPWLMSSREALWLFEPASRKVLACNEVASRLTGLDPDEARGWPLERLLGGPGAGATALARMSRVGREGGLFQPSERVELRVGPSARRALWTRVSRAAANEVPLGLLAASPIGERQNPSSGLPNAAGEDRMFETFFSLTDELACLVGGDGSLLWLSGGWEPCLGYRPDELLGAPIRALLHPDEPEWPPREARDRGPGDEGPSRFEARFLGRDGSERRLAWRLNFQGGVWHALARDVTPSWDEASRAKAEFLANMSHEIRTPMTAILGFTDLLLQHPNGPGTDAENHMRLAAVKQNGDRLMALIDDVLELSRIETGNAEVDLEACDVSRLAEDVARRARDNAAARGLSFALEFRGRRPPLVRTDPARLRRVLLHLLDNALKFTESGGASLVVACEGDPPAEIRLRFEVSDTGIGIEPEVASRLFEPFYQANGSRRRSRGGTGLGLALSRRLATLLGGSLELARATPGEGSTFVLAMPAVPLPSQAAPAPAPPQAPSIPAPREADRRPLAGKRVLIAEDNLDNQRVISIRLSMAGAHVTLASNGQEALEHAIKAREEARPFDLILMDMQMPILDGYEATRQLRAQDFRLPIIALTAHALPEDRRECLQFGCDAYMTKPVDWDQLFALLASLREGAACR